MAATHAEQQGAAARFPSAVAFLSQSAPASAEDKQSAVPGVGGSGSQVYVYRFLVTGMSNGDVSIVRIKECCQAARAGAELSLDGRLPDQDSTTGAGDDAESNNASVRAGVP